MNSVVINLGSISITWYSLCILFGIILAYIIINKEAKKYNISTNFITDLMFWCICFGILGARIYYVLFNLDYYSNAPIEVIKIWNGGLAIHGGIIAGLITLIIYCKKENVSILRITDIVTPGLIVAQAAGRWGNFFNAEAHGGIVTRAFLEKLHIPEFIINGMKIGGTYYHPTFLYESLLCLLGFLVIILIRRYVRVKKGNITSIYFIWYGIIRYFIESLRTDSLMLGNVKMAQVISIVMVLSGIIMLVLTSIKCKYYNKEEKEEKDAKGSKKRA